MAEKGDSSGTKSVLIFLGLIALIGVTCFAPICNGKTLLACMLPAPTADKDILILEKESKKPLEDLSTQDERDLDRLIQKAKKKNKK